MTQAQLRTAVRNITKEWETDSGTLFPTGDVVLDFYIEWACEDVVLDLVEFMPEDFLTSEDISLVANDFDYDLTAEWLMLWSLQRKVTDKSYKDIPYIPVNDRPDYVGETAEEPLGFFLKGTTIIFCPTPSAAKTDYARAWIVVPESASMAEDGPVYIPRMAHKLIPLEAAILIGYMNDLDIKGPVALYKIQKDRVIDSLTNRIQQQPQFLRPSVFSRISGDRRDKAFYDKGSPFDR